MDYLILSAGILLFYYCLFLLRIYQGVRLLKKRKNSRTAGTYPDISVVIPFRNEAENLPRLLSSLESQTYPRDKFEVILINDHSDDNSENVIAAHKGKLQLKLINLPAGTSGKKNAITIGVENSSGELIAGTDADCTHATGWLEVLAGEFDNATGLVTGPVTLETNGKILQQMQLLEHTGLSLSGAGLIANDHPVICSGANLAYRKSLFQKINGFNSQNTLTSGDDEQLMHKIFYDEGKAVKFIYNRECLVTTSPQTRTGDFLQQRRRWASKSFNYRPKTILILTPLFLFFASFVVMLIYAISSPAFYALPFLMMLLIKTVADFTVLYQSVPVYMGKFPAISLFLAEVLHPFYIVYSVLAGVFAGFNWKNRSHRK